MEGAIIVVERIGSINCKTGAQQFECDSCEVKKYCFFSHLKVDKKCVEKVWLCL